MSGGGPRGAAIADINVTPMVDVMLVLLIIFIVITPMLTKGISVDKVKARNPSTMTPADKDDAVIVAVTRDGKVYLGKTQMEPKELGPKIKDLISNKLDKTVYVNSDSRAKYGLVTKVVDNIRTAGVDAVGLLTEKLEEKGASASPGTAP
ncbi:MAG TPA: biopolymer transporter ExbD [Bryobacterales bacterium]|nr:biopolymer transporter ExbD [Bryobacterales bacterium]